MDLASSWAFKWCMDHNMHDLPLCFSPNGMQFSLVLGEDFEDDAFVLDWIQMEQYQRKCIKYIIKVNPEQATPSSENYNAKERVRHKPSQAVLKHRFSEPNPRLLVLVPRLLPCSRYSWMVDISVEGSSEHDNSFPVVLIYHVAKTWKGKPGVEPLQVKCCCTFSHSRCLARLPDSFICMVILRELQYL